jgi:hypothetical protein
MDYRLLLLSSSGETANVEEWACASDVEAVDRASRHVSAFGRELWQGDRHIGAFAGSLTAQSAGDQADGRVERHGG